MKMRDYSRLDAFLDRCAGDLYPDVKMTEAREITSGAIDHLHKLKLVGPGVCVLDVGCGVGFAVTRFVELGCKVVGLDLAQFVGLTLGGSQILVGDQSFIPFGGVFDGLFARHVLEHSVMPYFTLSEYWRALKPGGWCYIELPSPETACDHELNRNHYCVMGRKMWVSLMQRAGFAVCYQWQYNFAIPQDDGSKIDDVYMAFLLKKETGHEPAKRVDSAALGEGPFGLAAPAGDAVADVADHGPGAADVSEHGVQDGS